MTNEPNESNGQVRPDGPVDLLSLLPEELEAFAESAGLPRYRGTQIWDGLCRGAKRLEDISTLPKSAVRLLESSTVIRFAEVEEKLVSALDGTVKFLFRMTDGKAVEGVLMQYQHGYSLCLSTQVGCRMGCSFCASTKAGLDRSLHPSEMIGQILACRESTGITPDHLVLMGMGEPLDNYENVLKFLRLVNHPRGLNIGMRHISLSTCGLVPMMDRLASEKLGLTLSVSLHAATDEKRKQIMPVANAYSIRELMDACDRYTKATGRRISYEYALIAGVNDSVADANEVGRLLKNRLAHLNLIPVNPIKERSFRRSGQEAVRVFAETVQNGYGIPVTVRRKLGSDIDASCGQLRAKRDGL
ncbi:MAG: 23S rRNA (adenine(2503)-C(2))-methyltransferase RlmN [Clostridia bacterium]|nr:23S rRNA (adenine(2503)-C(2))-methyltransferase RlmN [Clostridia bacterium]